MIKELLKLENVKTLSKESMKTLEGGNNDLTQEFCELGGGSWEYNFGNYHCVYGPVDNSDNAKQ